MPRRTDAGRWGIVTSASRGDLPAVSCVASWVICPWRDHAARLVGSNKRSGRTGIRLRSVFWVGSFSGTGDPPKRLTGPVRLVDDPLGDVAELDVVLLRRTDQEAEGVVLVDAIALHQDPDRLADDLTSLHRG